MKFNRSLFPFVFILTLLMVWASPLRADVPPVVVVRFSVLCFSERISDLYYFDEGVPKLLSVSRLDISGPFDYKGPPLLQFFRKGPTAADGTLTWIPVAKITLPLSTREILLLFEKEGDAAESYRLTNIDAFQGNFKLNEVMIVNFSAMNVGGQFDRTKFQLSPGGSKKIAYPVGENQGHPAMLRLAAERSDGWKMVYSKPFAQTMGMRHWLFIVGTDVTAEKIQVLSYRERIAEPPASVQSASSTPSSISDTKAAPSK